MHAAYCVPAYPLEFRLLQLSYFRISTFRIGSQAPQLLYLARNVQQTPPLPLFVSGGPERYSTHFSYRTNSKTDSCRDPGILMALSYPARDGVIADFLQLM